jgi:hypothetical protein
MKKAKKYLIAIRGPKKNEIFEFKTKQDRALFIKDVKKIYKNIEYATSESLWPW